MSGKAVGITFGIIGGLAICAGVSLIVIYPTIAKQKEVPKEDDSNNSIPNIDSANITYSPTKEKIYNQSVPVMFGIARNQNLLFLNGTAWVFDRELQSNGNLVTYYLATNLHVINLWEGSFGTVNRSPITNVALFLGNKTNYYPYTQDTAQIIDYYKWKYLNNSRTETNFSDWYISNSIYDWPILPILMSNNYINPNKTKDNSFWTNISDPPETGGFEYELIPNIGIEKNVDLGIIKINVNKDKISNFPFLEYFDSLIETKTVDQIYDLNQAVGENLKISIAGFPGMTDNTWIYSAFNTWTNQNSNEYSTIEDGDGNRGSVQYQGVEGKIQSETYFGNALNANLNHGSSGSMVVNNNTDLIEGIYWGGIEKRNNQKYFEGRYVPFGINGILESWTKYINDNNLHETYISNYFNSPTDSANKFKSNNQFMTRYLIDFILNIQQTIQIIKY